MLQIENIDIETARNFFVSSGEVERKVKKKRTD